MGRSRDATDALNFLEIEIAIGSGGNGSRRSPWLPTGLVRHRLKNR